MKPVCGVTHEAVRTTAAALAEIERSGNRVASQTLPFHGGTDGGGEAGSGGCSCALDSAGSRASHRLESVFVLGIALLIAVRRRRGVIKP